MYFNNSISAVARSYLGGNKMKLLPFPKTPMFLCYHNRAFPFGIIQANSPTDITKWACTKCVNCNFLSELPHNKFNIAVTGAWGDKEQLVTYKALYLMKESWILSDNSLLQTIRNSIDDGFYVHGNYNEKYIQGKWTYGREDCIHDFLIIGYGEEKFISVGYLATGRFEQFEIPNENLITALRTTPGERIKLNLFKYNAGALPTPNVERMVEDLKKYISTADFFYNPFPKINVYGIAATARLKTFFLDEIQQGNVYVDRRYSLAFGEHKRTMAQLVDLFLDDEEKKIYQESANKNFEKAKIVHMLGLKMSCNRNASLINRISKLMDEIIIEEISYIPSLINFLQEKYSIN